MRIENEEEIQIALYWRQKLDIFSRRLSVSNGIGNDGVGPILTGMIGHQRVLPLQPASKS
jgi:hypothetical protein